MPSGLSNGADEVTRTAIALFLDAQGPPPSPFAWVVLGSHGRGELHCASDQDSGLVWQDEASARSAYAAELAGAVIDALADWGLARCSGGFTADHWSHDLAHWRTMIRNWVWDPDPRAVIDTEVFLDFRPLAGDLPVTELSDAIRAGAESPRLMHGLAVAATSFPPALTPLGNLPRGVIQAKGSGLSALVLLARLFALKAGSAAIGTRQRLTDSAAAGVLGADLVTDLVGAYRTLTTIRLRTQLSALDAALTPDNRIDVTGLSRDDRSELRHGMKAIRSAQKAAEFVFRTEL